MKVAIFAGLAAIGGLGVSLLMNLGSPGTTGHGQSAQLSSSASITGPEQQVINQLLPQVPNSAELLASYQSEKVDVSVNGASVGLVPITSLASSAQQAAMETAANGLVQAAQNATPSASDITNAASSLASATAQRDILDTAIAESVLQQLLYNYADTNGIAQSQAAAQAEATSNYNAWVAQGSPPLPIPGYLPASTTDRDMFLSTNAISSLQFIDSVLNAETAVAGPPTSANHMQVNREPELRQWFESNVVSNAVSVSVGGVAIPPALLPAMLPASL